MNSLILNEGEDGVIVMMNNNKERRESILVYPNMNIKGIILLRKIKIGDSSISDDIYYQNYKNKSEVNVTIDGLNFVFSIDNYVIKLGLNEFIIVKNKIEASHILKKMSMFTYNNK